MGQPRNRTFDFLRLFFATLVLLSHAPEITGGNRHRELFDRIAHSGLTFGEIAVDGFFLLSGYLILKSWLADPKLMDYLRKRFLRIVPGYVVAVIVSVLLASFTASPHFFADLGSPFLKSVLRLGAPITPPVWRGNPYPVVNGAMWTIGYEFRCYILIAVCGLLGVFRVRMAWLLATVVLLLNLLHPLLQAHLAFNPLWGEPRSMFRLLTPFFVGGCFLLFRDKIRFHGALALVACGLLVVSFLAPLTAEAGFVVSGGYLIFYLGQLPSERALHWFREVPDISYGVYLYGWPIESAVAWCFHPSPWLNFTLAVPLCLATGWISWKLVEGPMLKRKQGALPPRWSVPAADAVAE